MRAYSFLGPVCEDCLEMVLFLVGDKKGNVEFNVNSCLDHLDPRQVMKKSSWKSQEPLQLDIHGNLRVPPPNETPPRTVGIK